MLDPQLGELACDCGGIVGFDHARSLRWLRKIAHDARQVAARAGFN
jgi:hypothetical protein